MEQIALTRASTLGPILDFVEEGGGSVERIFQMAELPLRLCEKPHTLIPLRDQFRIVELAAKELGDDALPARLSTSVGVVGLGLYGRLFVSAPTLGAAIRQGNRIYTATLQSGTEMTLTTEDKMARWTYVVTDKGLIGRQKNEVLAIGYMVDLLRRFLGTDWIPTRVQLPGAATLQGRAQIEAQYRCEITSGNIVSMHFPAELLETPNPNPKQHDLSDLPDKLPALEDFPGCVQEIVRLGLLSSRPQRDWVARRLEMSVRTLQRRLNETGTSFAGVMQRVIERQAAELLLRRDIPVSDIAYELGYSDPAHFARAFTNWFGESPTAWRDRNTNAK